MAPERLAGALLLLALVPPAHAEDEDRALQAFARPSAVVRSAPADAIEWERRLRTPGTMAAKPPRDIDMALLAAARAGDDEAARKMVRRGAATDFVGLDGFTPLAAAAFEGRRSTVRLLLRAGADPARLTASGQTALHLAALAGRVEVIDELLRAGVDIELLNRQRDSALDVAAAAGRGESMDRLLAAGADATKAGSR